MVKTVSKSSAKVWIFPAKWWRNAMRVGQSRSEWKILTLTFGYFEAVWLIEFSIFSHWFWRNWINLMHLGLLMHQDSHCALKITFKIKEVLFFLETPFQTINYYLKPPSLHFKMASVEGATVLIQLLIILEVLLIVNLLNKSYYLYLYWFMSICVTGCSIG